MIEMLFVLVCISLFSMLSFNQQSLSSIRNLSSINLIERELLTTKLAALKNKDRICTTSELILTSKELCFNNKGNVNQAQSLKILKSQKQIIVHLGSGYYEIK